MAGKSELVKLKNIGEGSARVLNSIDIYTKEDLEKLGPVNIVHILKAHGFEVNSLMAYAIYGAIHNIHWNDVPSEIKEQLKEDIKNSPFEDFKV